MKNSSYFKKIMMVAFIPIVALFIGLFATSIFPSNADYGNDFKVNGSTLVKYNGTDRNVQIPSGITQIAPEAFSSNPLIESVSLPDSLNTIGNMAFYNCSNLTSINIPDSVSSIGNSAFYGCTNLKDVTIGSGLREIGYGIFSDCKSLKTVLIDDYNEFFTCLNGVIYSKDLSKLYQYLPGNNREQFTIPSEVNKVLDYAFWGADNIRELNLSSSIDSINDYAFSNMDGLEAVTIYEPTRVIGAGAFANDTNLHQVIMPVSMVDIRTSAFSGCPKDLTLICDGNSYVNKYAMTNGYESASVPVYQVVYNEPAPSEEDDDTSTTEDDKDHVLSGDNNGPSSSQETNTSEVTANGTVLDQTTIVSDRAYIVLDDMTVHDLNNFDDTLNLAKLGDYKFYNSNISSFDLAATYPNLAEIGQLSFGRSKISSIDIPAGVTAIDYAAFYHCDQLKEVNIPTSVTYVGGLAFDFTPWFEEWKASSDNEFLVVGDGVLIAYKGSSDTVVIPDNIKYISQYAFKNNQNIKQVNFHEGIIRIDSDAFYGCEGLAIVTGLSNNTSIDSNAFNGCGL